MVKKPKAKYPAWVCTECAEANGGRMPEFHFRMVRFTADWPYQAEALWAETFGIE